ncbi:MULTISPECIES: GAF domain-containing protein [Amycolatopsis]|nr:MULTISPECIES: GAF domain-containing protein [Amycolatopsis]UKD59174.1 transcriptional regulator [Amycolatopsis sp. FU40]
MGGSTTGTDDDDVGMSMHGLGSLRRRRLDLEQQWAEVVPRLRDPARLPGDVPLRQEVAESWMRSVPTVDPATDRAPVSDGGVVRPRWSESPLRAPVLRVAGELRTIADDAGFIAAVTDETGTILWTCGGRVMRRRAERVNFAPGGCWDEPAMGTNALSLALRTGRPSAVFSAEHLVAALHGWVCYCAPIRDARGRMLGVLDLSSTWDRSHPLAMSTVRSLVSAIESGLPAVSPAGLRISSLGVAAATRDGVPLNLRPRQVEILTLLALQPDGFSLDALREALYGDRPVTSTTVRAEASHLRNALGGVVSSRRYASTMPIGCDAVDVLRALERRDLATAVRLYRGPLLPQSEAPGIVQWRDHLEVAMRSAVLVSDAPEHALAYGERALYDAEVHEHALAVLAPGDARRAVAAGRLAVARRE